MLAKDTVERCAKESNVNTQVVALKIPVAALLTPETILKGLKEVKAKDYDVILVPGLIRGDTAVISSSLGIPAFKGPRYAADLPTVLDSLGEVKLSTVIPACDLLREKLKQKALEELEKAEQNSGELLKNPGNMLIGNLAVGRDFPMRVMAEIVDAALMKTEEVQRLAKHFAQAGAHIIDIGMVSGESKPLDAARMVKAVKSVVNAPVSIDTLDPKEIKEAVRAGADLILSADGGNIKEIAEFVKDAAVVVIPTNQREGYFPKKANERVQLLEQLIDDAQRLGIKNILADLILEPSNILESFIAFREFEERNPTVPLFVGVSNVTELIDIDSVGINGLLARLSSEVGASIILATEKSDKTKGTVSEQVTAAKMMFLSRKRGSVPKDLGIDLLVLKDKRFREELYDKGIEANAQVVRAKEKSEPAILEPECMFKIAVDRAEGTLVAVHFASVGMDKPVNVIKGKTAESVYGKIMEMGLVKRLDHAAYLGSELAKAEIALRTGKEYIQDSGLFIKHA